MLIEVVVFNFEWRCNKRYIMILISSSYIILSFVIRRCNKWHCDIIYNDVNFGYCWSWNEAICKWKFEITVTIENIAIYGAFERVTTLWSRLETIFLSSRAFESGRGHLNIESRKSTTGERILNVSNVTLSSIIFWKKKKIEKKRKEDSERKINRSFKIHRTFARSLLHDPPGGKIESNRREKVFL